MLSSVFFLDDCIFDTGQPPACNCTAISSTKNNITCSLTYYDSSFNPINAKMTWTSNGNFFRNDTPARTKIETYTWASTSFVTVDINDPATYQCTVTFAKPTSISVSLTYVATNAPQFSAPCAPLCKYDALSKIYSLVSY